MFFNRKHSSGISLLEVLLVFLVAAMIALFSVEYYRHLRVDEDVLIVQKNADILMHAINTYYREHENETKFPDPDQPTSDSYKQNLKNEESLWPGVWSGPNSGGRLLPTQLVVASSSDDSSYDVKIPQSLTSPHFMLQVIIVLTVADASTTPSAATAEWYLQAFNAKTAVPQSGGQIVLTWEQLPSASIHDVETNLWVLGSGLQQFKQNNATQ